MVVFILEGDNGKFYKKQVDEATAKKLLLIASGFEVFDSLSEIDKGSKLINIPITIVPESVNITLPDKPILPKGADIEAFIMAQPNYAHNVDMVCMKFIGKKLKSNSKDRKEKNLYHSLSKKTERVRLRIKQKEMNGNWKVKRKFSLPATYVFKKKVDIGMPP